MKHVPNNWNVKSNNMKRSHKNIKLAEIQAGWTILIVLRTQMKVESSSIPVKILIENSLRRHYCGGFPLQWSDFEFRFPFTIPVALARLKSLDLSIYLSIYCLSDKKRAILIRYL